MWVTKELLLNIFDHSLELRIWDSKDKVSARARFDRPKAFRLPAGQENEEDAGNHGGSSNVKALVLKQSLSHAQLQPKESREMRGKLKRRVAVTRGAPNLEFSNSAGTGFTGFGQKFRPKFRPDLPDLKQDILG